ncbi:MAG: DUF4403 family protein [Pseudomonadales bacterium]|nr:DUF4403 family protein [Pseudomonadales bacterium]
MRSSIWAILAMLLLGCAHAPISPPPNDPLVQPAPNVELSQIDVPVSLNLLSLRAELLNKLPRPLSQGEVSSVMRLPGGGALPLQTTLRHKLWIQDVQLRVDGQQFTVVVSAAFSVQAVMQGGASAATLASCGWNEAPAQVRLRLQGTLQTGARGLQLSPGPWTLEWIRPCQLTALHVDVGAILNLPVVRDRLRAQVDETLRDGLGTTGIHAALSAVWPQLNSPLSLGHGLWLMLHPVALALAGVQGQGYVLNLRVQMQAKPEIVAVRPATTGLPAMPALGSWPTVTGFHVVLNVNLPLSRAGTLMDEVLADRTLLVGSHRVVIEHVVLYGHKQMAVLGLHLREPVDSLIYILATPVFDSQRGELSFKDLNFSLETESRLARTAAWMLGDNLKRQLMQRLHIPFSDAVHLLRTYTRAPLDLGAGLHAQIDIQEVHPQGLWLTPDSVQTVVVADGHLQLSYGLP